MIKVDLSYSGVGPEQISNILDAASAAHDTLVSGAGAGGEYTGWVGLEPDENGIGRIEQVAGTIKGTSDALVVVGIGGSYLGARAVIELIKSGGDSCDTKVYFAGNTLSERAMTGLIRKLEGADYSVCVISKSGTTTEPAVAFRVLLEDLERRYGKSEAAKRVYAITDAQKGAMRALADREGYESFIIPDDIGGRYSVLTPVGLVPLAVAGIDIRRLLDGMRAQRRLLLEKGPDNAAWQYAIARSILYQSGKKVELLCAYEPDFRFMGEWYKQLFGESEGKDGKGLFPAYAEFTADLHSLGQYIQQGERHLFETVVRFEDSAGGVQIPAIEGEGDGLACVTGKTMGFLAEQAFIGTAAAHVEGGVPNIVLQAGPIDERTAGELIYFFEFACGVSAYLLNVNPFDQPGVESYKRNMFALIGKPGYEELRAKLKADG